MIRTFLYIVRFQPSNLLLESKATPKGDWRLHSCLEDNPADWFKRNTIFGLFLKSGLLALATAEAMMTSSYVQCGGCVGFCSCVKRGEREGTNGYCRSWILLHVLITPSCTDTVKDCRFSHSNYGCKSNVRSPGSCP